MVRVVDSGDAGLMHLTLTGGDGTGNCASDGCGGGLYVMSSGVHVGLCVITGNVGSSTTGGALGGGFYAASSDVQIWESRIVSNTAGISATKYCGYDGGIFVYAGNAELWLNEIADNVGSVPYSGSGGVHLSNLSRARVLSNTIRGNRSNLAGYWSGAGGF